MTQVDPDLDVVRWRDRRVEIIDVEEFDEHRGRFGYPEELITEAMDAAERAVHMVRKRVEPFGETAKS